MQIDFITEDGNLVERHRAESYKEIDKVIKTNTNKLDVIVRALHKMNGENK